MDHTAFESMMKQIEEWDKLEKMRCNLCGTVFKGKHECQYEVLKEQNEIMKSALRFYAYEEKSSVIEEDEGEIALNALKKIGYL